MSSDNFECKEHTAPAQHIRHYYRATSRFQEDVLHLAVKQYTPRDNPDPQPGDVTILACHASGFPKELYEPMWDEMLRISRTTGAFRIRSIWIADVVNQGHSGVLNEDKLGNDPSYFDHARDMLHMVNHFRASLPRPLIGIGHSMGGVVMVNLALMHPRLLSTLIIIEPIIESRVRELYKRNYVPWLLASRTSTWPTHEAAIEAIAQSPLYKTWHPSVLRLLESHGLRPLPSRGAAWTLTTTKHQELASYARFAGPRQSPAPPRTTHPDLGSGEHRDYDSIFYLPEATQTYAQLPFLRPSCLYIYGTQSALSTAREGTRHDKLMTTGIAVGGSGGVSEGAVKEVLLRGDHFVPFQIPGEVARVSAEWAAAQLEKWRMVEEVQARDWEAVAPRERACVDRDMLVEMERESERRKQQRRHTKEKSSNL